MKHWRIPGLAAVALAGLLGVTHFLGLSGAQAGEDSEVIVFTVRLPADAVLEIEGHRTESSGEVRSFQTPPLTAGGHYAYTLKATSKGKEVTRKVHLAHGVDNSFDLRAEFRPGATDKPDPKQLTTVGQQKTAPNGSPKEEEALRRNAEAFVDAFHKGDAKTLASFWTTDGEYTDQNGRLLKGREAIEKAFRGLFAENNDLKLRITGDSLRFVTPEVAVEEGTTEVFTPDGAPPSRARYTNVHVKREGRWLLGSVRDSPFVPPSNFEYLRALEWAIGDWAGEGTKGEVERLSVVWAENQNFMNATFSTTMTTIKNISVGSARQWIGWDPEAKRVRSWIFDSTGGFGEGSFSQEGKKWIIKTRSILQDGKKATATFVIGSVDADTITLQSKDRSIDGQPVPDTKEVRLRRIK